MKLTLNTEFGLYEKNGQPFCDSLQVAETFNKQHNTVLRDIRELGCSDDFRLYNFVQSSYRNEQNKKQPKYLLTKDGFTLLVMGYTGKKAMAFKEAYIVRFNQMEVFIKSLQALKLEFPAFTDAIMLANLDAKPYHYSNEVNMIYRLVLGMDAKKYRKQIGIAASEPLRPHLTHEQIQAVEYLQRIDVGLIVAGLSYDERKAKLSASAQRRRLLAAS